MSTNVTTTCREVRLLMGQGGAAALDEAAQDHVAGCERCFEILEAIGRIDEGLPRMPRHDAPDAAVAALLAHPELRQPPRPVARVPLLAARVHDVGRRAAHWVLGSELRWAALATPAALLVMAGLVLLVRSGGAPRSGARRTGIALGSYQVDYGAYPGLPANPPPIVPTATPEEPDRLRGLGYLATETSPVHIPSETPPVYTPPDAPPAYFPPDGPPVYTPPAPPKAGQELASGNVNSNGVRADANQYLFDGGKSAVEVQIEVRAHEDIVQPEKTQTSTALNNEFVDNIPVLGRTFQALLLLAPGIGDPATDGKDEAGRYRGTVTARVSGSAPAAPPATPPDAAAFLAEREVVDELPLQPAEGYWANTYLPGDRELRELLAKVSGSGLSAHEGARRVTQPFDAPADSALGLQLQADRRAVTGRSRVLLQVGIAGSERSAGRRSAMSLAVVLDLRDALDVAQLAAMRAILETLAESRESGDRFSLLVAGRGPGGVVVAPEDFRSGELVVKLEELAAAAAEGPALFATMAAGVEQACTGDDPSAPLGSTAVLLVTARPVGPHLAALESLAHSAGVRGVPTSVVAVGTGVKLDELDRLVLAGQGRRRLVLDADDAPAAIDDELTAVGRAVARAVRLSIRLAPGVELVGVVGSERLDTVASARVKEVEESIDRRLSSSLGIQQDRGLDEEGIQIVIPTFDAGDRHAIVLDLVAPGAGELAEVSAHYKDLVYMRNGEAHAAFDLGRGEAPRGPLEANVLKNLLAHRMGRGLESAGARLMSGDVAGARAELATWRALLAELPGFVPVLARDADLAADVALLDAFAALLADGTALDRAAVASALRYSGRLKVLPPPYLEMEELP